MIAAADIGDIGDFGNCRVLPNASKRGNDAAFADHLPWQAECQRVKLRARERPHRIAFTRPDEAPLVKPARGEPHADAIVHEHLHPARSPVGEEVGMVWARRAKDFDDPTERCVRAGAHVQRLHRQPHCVDPDHFNNSRNHTAQSAEHSVGRLIDTVVGPRLSSIRMSGKEVSRSACGIGSAMNAAVVDEAAAGCISLRHLCTRLAFRPLAIATWATDAPGSAQAATTRAFRSAACRLRVEGVASGKVST